MPLQQLSLQRTLWPHNPKPPQCLAWQLQLLVQPTLPPFSSQLPLVSCSLEQQSPLALLPPPPHLQCIKHPQPLLRLLQLPPEHWLHLWPPALLCVTQLLISLARRQLPCWQLAQPQAPEQQGSPLLLPELRLLAGHFQVLPALPFARPAPPSDGLSGLPAASASPATPRSTTPHEGHSASEVVCNSSTSSIHSPGSTCPNLTLPEHATLSVTPDLHVEPSILQLRALTALAPTTKLLQPNLTTCEFQQSTTRSSTFEQLHNLTIAPKI